ncbi:MAG: hypothetical protein PVI57_20985 [Gemmatimonadota bacterium]|jgi:hypothetical protein
MSRHERWRCALAVAGITALFGSGPARAQTPATERLLQLHHQQRVAHVLGDADLLSDLFADTLMQIDGGAAGAVRRDSARARFARYFAAQRFLEWEDVRPPSIRVSPDAAWAEVIVEKRVRTVPVDTSVGRQGYARFAWMERWRRDGEDWRLASIASTDRSVPDSSPVPIRDRVRAWEVLRRAREALGGEEAVARVATLRFTAACRGPNGPFRTSVASAVDGRVRFLQTFEGRQPFEAGVGLEGAWISGDGDVSQLDSTSESVVRAHEMHLLALTPEARFTNPVARPDTVVEGRVSHVVELTDALGGAVRFYYDARTGRPTAFSPVNHTGRGPSGIFAAFGDWRGVGEVQLPFRIVITQGEDVYRYGVTEASVEWQPSSVFVPATLERR